MYTSKKQNIHPFTFLFLIGLLLIAACEPLTPASNTSKELILQTNPVPEAYPNSDTSKTQIPQLFAWKNGYIDLKADLPASPVEANVYLALPDEPATAESALELARRFGIEGQVYKISDQALENVQYLVAAGGSRLYVSSDHSFNYYKDGIGPKNGGKNLSQAQVDETILDFMLSHGFEFEYKLEPASYKDGLYFVTPQLDGISLHYGHVMPARLEILLDDAGEITYVSGDLVSVQKIDSYAICSAAEAFRRILSRPPVGTFQANALFPRTDEKAWTRSYPENTSFTLYEYLYRYEPVDADQAPLFTLGGLSLAGNTDGMEDVQDSSVLEAQGQLVTKNGVRFFQVESWKPFTGEQLFSMFSFLQEKDGQIFMSVDIKRTYPLMDPPTDVPLDMPTGDQLVIDGFLVDGRVEWREIRHIPDAINAQGDSPQEFTYDNSPISFYQLALPNSKPFIAALQTNADDTLSPLDGRYENLRGTLNVDYYKQADGSLRAEYALVSKHYPLMYLQGDGLETLEDYHNRPVNIWGTIVGYDANNGWVPIVEVEKFEIPFPDLEFQILRGTEKMADMTGHGLFINEDGTTYIMLDRFGNLQPGISTFDQYDHILVESLAIPGETAEGFPAIRIFNQSPPFEDHPGQTTTLQVQADQPLVLEEPIRNSVLLPTPGPPSGPIFTIEKVELVYFIRDPRHHFPWDANAPQYVQPVWRFYGHDSNGRELEILVQALNDEFLSTDIQVLYERK
jgi:hypothetical protein